MMETIKDNWNIVSEGADFSTTFLGLDYRRRAPPDAMAHLSTVDNDGNRVNHSISVEDLYNLSDELEMATGAELETIVESDLFAFLRDSPLSNEYLPNEETITIPLVEDDDDPVPMEVAGAIGYIMAAHLNDPEYFSRHINDDNYDYTEMLNEIIATIEAIAYAAVREAVATVEDQPRAISILSLFMEIEDRSRNRFNYSMSENDRAFVLFLLERVIAALREDTAGDIGRVEDGDRDPEQLLRIIEGYAARDDPNIGEAELNNRMQFEAYVRGLEQLWFDAIDMGDVPMDHEIAEFFDAIRNDEDLNLPPFALARLDQAADRVRAHYPPIPGDA